MGISGLGVPLSVILPVMSPALAEGNEAAIAAIVRQRKQFFITVE
jgi:hypothetical protein